MSPTLSSCEYSAGSWGASLRPWPRRSHTTTWRSSASARRLGPHIVALAENPWVSSSGVRPPDAPCVS